MDNYTHRVSLKKPEKPEPWTDPVTGEIYPGGKPIDPTEVTSQAPAPTFRQAPTLEQDVIPQQTNLPTPQQVSVSPAPVEMPAGSSCFCRSCGQGITANDRFCPRCGFAQFGEQPRQVIINNYNNIGSNNTIVGGLPRNKWLAVVLCLFFGWLGVHRFYEHKTATGILWLCTGGLFGIGWLADLFILLFKPTTYYVKNK